MSSRAVADAELAGNEVWPVRTWIRSALAAAVERQTGCGVSFWFKDLGTAGVQRRRAAGTVGRFCCERTAVRLVGAGGSRGIMWFSILLCGHSCKVLAFVLMSAGPVVGSRAVSEAELGICCLADADVGPVGAGSSREEVNRRWPFPYWFACVMQRSHGARV